MVMNRMAVSRRLPADLASEHLIILRWRTLDQLNNCQSLSTYLIAVINMTLKTASMILANKYTSTTVPSPKMTSGI